MHVIHGLNPPVIYYVKMRQKRNICHSAPDFHDVNTFVTLVTQNAQQSWIVSVERGRPCGTGRWVMRGTRLLGRRWASFLLHRSGIIFYPHWDGVICLQGSSSGRHRRPRSSWPHCGRRTRGPGSSLRNLPSTGNLSQTRG